MMGSGGPWFRIEGGIKLAKNPVFMYYFYKILHQQLMQGSSCHMPQMFKMDSN